MPIPPIEPYPLPAEADLPSNRAGWQIDPTRCVLLVHDMQRYFVDVFPPGRPPVADLVRNIAGVRAAADRQEVPVVYTAQSGDMSVVERGLLRDFWGPGMSADDGQRRIVPDLAPRPAERVLTKWRYSAFVHTGLSGLLREHGRDQLVICGVYAHIGCLITACDAFSQDIQPFLVADGMADFSAAEHRMALEYTAGRCAVVLSSRAAVEALAAGPAVPPACGADSATGPR